MSTELLAALIGALVGGGFAVLGSLLQHWLSLREDRIKREREAAEQEQRIETRVIDGQIEKVDEELARLVNRYSYVIDELSMAGDVVAKRGDVKAHKIRGDLLTEIVFLNENIQRLREDRQRLIEQRRKILSR